MAEPSLEETFGVGTTQDATTITIPKAPMAGKGLTASATNRAESLLVAILLIARDTLSTTRQNLNPEQSITIEDSFESLTVRGTPPQTYRQTTLSLNLQRADTGAAIDPDDY